MHIIPDDRHAVAVFPRSPLHMRLRVRLAISLLENWQPVRLRRRLRETEEKAAAYEAVLKALGEALLAADAAAVDTAEAAL
jgi:hypothetical protein